MEKEQRETKSKLDQEIAEKRQLSQEVGRAQAQRQNAEKALEEKEKQLSQYWKILEIRQNELRLDGKKLGSGSYGVVQVGHWCDVPVAVKTFHENLRLPQLAPVFKRELTICSQLHHPNLVPIYGGVMKNEIPIQIVMELLQGSLSDLMKAAHASKSYHCYLSFREQIDVATDTTAAITYMHRLRPQPYVHCDIRTTNVMITRDMVAKVGDLGASHIINSSKSLGALSPEYCAPEKLPRSDGSSARSTRESDVYSLGVTLTELFTGLSPIPAERQNQIRKIKNPDLLDMCLQMTHDRPAERPTAEMAFTILINQKSVDLYRSIGGRRTVKGNLEGEDMYLVDFMHS
ncbi:uncharacterized protein LOC134188650 [Corticium candelabrum]|uniref:uncharacterized protein LOC134188650 n=1 Tax=Corticium candelabrum TaxID=121492 RepID=UPI002E25CF1D|nr:uncharacterized protein LOC134188650 [Corticium candelabrum]